MDDCISLYPVQSSKWYVSNVWIELRVLSADNTCGKEQVNEFSYTEVAYFHRYKRGHIHTQQFM